jgi:DNA-binding transcriptional LysR family regulator
MELKQLRHFIVLAEELHFGNAAKRLHMTQPPLSNSIMQLEETLGTRLFDRDSRSVRLTAVGKAFLPEAIRTVSQAKATEEAGIALAKGNKGNLQIAFTSSMIYRGMPEVLQIFSKTYPNIHIRLLDLTVMEQAEALRNQQIHAGFSSGQNIPSELTGKKLKNDSFVLCTHKSHWAASKRSVHLSELKEEDFIIFSRDITPSGYTHVVSMCLRAGFYPREKANVRQWITAALMVSKAMGIAITPASLQRAQLTDVAFIPIEDPDTKTSGYFIWNPDALSPSLTHLIDLVN